MPFVTVTIQVQGNRLSVDQVKDKTVASALRKMGSSIGIKLENVLCREHGRGPSNIRVHVGSNGEADLAYDSCCAALQEAVTKALE